MKKKRMLFPEFLPIGSQGAGVLIVQLLLKASGYNSKIIADGDYGDETATGVKKLQEDLGVDPDGCFGPNTRKAYFEKTGINLNTIPSLIFKRKTTTPE